MNPERPIAPLADSGRGRSPASAPADGGRGLVILPTYNEVDSIAGIVERVLAQDSRLSVLVVDDASPDGTGALVDSLAAAEPRVNVLHREGKLGLGTAYIAGFRWALKRDFEWIFEMDADGSHDARYISDMIAAADRFDVVVGSRYTAGVNVINWPMSRLLLSYYANKYARIATGLRLADSTSGFKCFARRVLETIDLDRVGSTGYTFQIEMNFRAWKKGFRVGEVPIVFTDRRVGQSKMSGAIVREAVWRVWALRLRSLIGRL
ncbi:polyprenol monophosphomannose synthase [Candidatus Palauibacter polyketidifaciens]|uniref:polyprenol monophosphomannose synthase n=1 Tax=Candidatus Palauibacter polyketidifaciens TaxID=3056740 RepID=UPI002387EF51|nr:polyprenol monophosphomannose synthase [Candidatus Palauibacter polyketidifaciens]MDE2721380.1 polyprenol monophosphomannose synthase [Candidatus Palauibacter polyketidifaciens]